MTYINLAESKQEAIREHFELLYKCYLKHEDVSEEANEDALKFLEAGCDSEILLEMMSSDGIYRKLDDFFSRGIAVNMSRLAERLSSTLLSNRLAYLLDKGMSITDAIQNMNSSDVEENRDILYDHGLSFSDLMKFLNGQGERFWIAFNKDVLREEIEDPHDIQMLYDIIDGKIA